MTTALYTRDGFVYWFLAWALEMDGKPDDALRTMQAGIRLDPALEDLFAMQIGAAYLHSGRYQQAISAYKRNAASYPNILATPYRPSHCLY